MTIWLTTPTLHSTQIPAVPLPASFHCMPPWLSASLSFLLLGVPLGLCLPLYCLLEILALSYQLGIKQFHYSTIFHNMRHLLNENLLSFKEIESFLFQECFNTPLVEDVYGNIPKWAKEQLVPINKESCGSNLHADRVRRFTKCLILQWETRDLTDYVGIVGAGSGVPASHKQPGIFIFYHVGSLWSKLHKSVR